MSWYWYSLCSLSGSTVNVSVIVLGDSPPVLFVYTNFTSGFSPVDLNLINWFNLSPVDPKSVVFIGILHIKLPTKAPA